MKTILSFSRDVGFCLVLSLLWPLTAALAAVVEIPNAGYAGGNVYGNSKDGGISPDSPPAENSILNITSGTVTGNAYGGYGGAGPAVNNTVAVGGGATIGTTASSTGNVFGGWSGVVYNSRIEGNRIEINNAVVRGIVFGGWVEGGNGNQLLDNTVFINAGATLRGNLYGAYSQGNLGALSGNHIVIDGGSVTASGAIIAGAYSAIGVNDISSNTVTLNSGVVNNAAIYGGRGQSGSNVQGNSILINGGTIARGTLFGGQTINGAGTVSENSVIITDGTVNATIYGGYSGGKGQTLNNTVAISGGTVTGDIYGGYSSSASATHNIVTIGGTASLGQGANLFGGYVNSGGGDAFTGNALNLNAENYAALGEVRNFEELKFGYSGDAKIDVLHTTATGSAKPGVILDTDGNTVNFGGLITGTGSLTKTGTGILELSGNEDNLFFGGLHIRDGSVAFSRPGQIATGEGKAVTLQGSSTLRFDADLSLGSQQTIVIDGTSGVFDTNGRRVSINGVIDGQNGDMVKAGAGELILTNDNAAIRNGTVLIQQGTLQLGDGGMTGSLAASGGFDIASGAALAYRHDGSVSLTETQRITGAGAVIQCGAGTLALQNTANFFTGGTELTSGRLRIVDNYSLNQAAGGANFGTKAGYITFTGTSGTKTVTLDNADAGGITLANSFRTQDGAGGLNIVDLTLSPNPWISDVNTADKGGAFYVAPGTSMDVFTNNLGMSGNTAGGAANDLYVEAGGEFNLHAGGWTRFQSGMEINGIFNLYSGSMTLFESGISGEGELNIAAGGSFGMAQLSNASVPKTFHMGATTIVGSNNNVIFLNLARNSPSEDRVVFSNTRSFTISGEGDGAFTAASLFGDGIIQAGESISVTKGAVLAPFNPNTLNAGTLTLQAPKVTLSDFGLAVQVNYDGTGASRWPLSFDAGIPIANNDLLNIDSPEVSMSNGMVFFSTAGGTAPFAPGDYLVIRSTDGFAEITDNYALNARLNANVDGFFLNPADDSPRGGYEFKLGGDPAADGSWTGGKTNVWFTHMLNSLTMAWTGGGSESTPLSGTWESGELFYSRLDNGGNGVHETRFLTGDKVHIAGENAFAITLPAADDADDIVVSGLVVGRGTDGATDANNGNYTVRGPGGITADASSAFGRHYEDGTLVPTGMLQKYGGNTLTFENEGVNLFKEGIELYGGTVVFDRAEQLQVDTGKAISFGYDSGSPNGATLSAKGVIALDAPVALAPDARATLHTDAGSALLLNERLYGNPNTTLNKTGGGILQIGNDMTGQVLGTTLIREGAFRVVNGFSFLASQFALNLDATLGGGGTVRGDGIEIYGTLSPDSDRFTASRTVVSDNAAYGTLTLAGSGIRLGSSGQPFTMDFDINGEDGRKDLLIIQGVGGTTVNLASGQINFRGALATGADYLVIQGKDLGANPYTLGGASLNDTLSATLNGVDLSAGGEPRGSLQFLFGNDAGPQAGAVQGNNIWLSSTLNSLTMNWTGSGDETNPQGGSWSFDATFNSLQRRNGNPTTEFQIGDEALLYNTDPSATLTVTLAEPTLAVSGLLVGARAERNGSARSLRDFDGNVTIDGSGTLHADSALAFGDYLGGASTEPRLNASGMLEKRGAGTLTLSNAGANIFKAGTRIDQGTIVVGAVRALGSYDLQRYSDLGLSGQVDFSGTSGSRAVEIDAGVQAIQNYFRADGSINNTFRNKGDLTISGIANPGPGTEGVSDWNSRRGGAFFVDGSSGNAALTIRADGHLTLSGNTGWNGMPNDVMLACGTGGAKLELITADNVGIFVQSGIAGSGTGLEINIDSSPGASGFVQIGADSRIAAATMVAAGGTLRVLDGKTFGDRLAGSLTAQGRLEGSGTLAAGTIDIRGTISPDKDAFAATHTTLADDKKYAVLTLAGAGSALSLGTASPFAFEYDVRSANSDAASPENTPNDLLALAGFTTIAIGTGNIDFRTDTAAGKLMLDRGKYLIVNADSSISGADLSGLTASLNQAAFDVSPRQSHQFRFNNTATEAALPNSQLWFDVDVNSLTMTWTGGGTKVAPIPWTDGELFQSLQTSNGLRETRFLAGDKVHIAGADAFIELPPAPSSGKIALSGLVVGQDVDGNITNGGAYAISGAGGITTDKTCAFGAYIGNTLTPTGKLQKYGDNTLTFTNTGGNLFIEGIELYGGTLSFNRADQLAVGDGEGITFKSNAAATLQSNDDVALDTLIAVEAGADATLKVTGSLTLSNNRAEEPAKQESALHVESGGTLNLHLEKAGAAIEDYARVAFLSGISGEGALNITSAGPAAVLFQGNGDPRQSFHMGTTTVDGDLETVLWLAQPTEASSRVTFENSNAFTLNGAALMGDGIISAGTSITVWGGVLAPTSVNTDAATWAAGTLTLKAPQITLDNFTLLYMAYGGTQAPLTRGIPGSIANLEIPAGNNSLLNLVGGPVTLGNGMALFVTADGSPFARGDYLVIRSDNGFIGIGSDADLDGKLLAAVDGFLLNPTAGGPRGGFSFHLGGEPDVNNGRRTTDTKNNIWFTHELNSLTMEWTGGPAGDPLREFWTNGERFISLQAIGNNRDYAFLSGDKVHIAGGGAFGIELPAGDAISKIVVSGLVVGQDAAGNVTNGGAYAISGAGGITAVKGSAFGAYVGDTLTPTGMLQKYGDNTLAFTNTGGNLFAEGIELYGGTVSFNRADQLAVGEGMGIAFKGDATLQSNADARLDAPVTLANGNTATFRTENGNTLLLGGEISGAGSLSKTGAGILILTGENSYGGGSAVNAGILQIGNGGASGSVIGDIAVHAGAELVFNRADSVAFDGVVSGAGRLTKDGQGVLTLTGTNVYTGGTTVGKGVLAGNIPEGGDLTVQLGATYDGADAPRSVGDLQGGGALINARGLTVRSGDFSGVISGAGSLTKTGADTLILSGPNTYTGLTEVRAGTLALSGTGRISDTLALYEGTTFSTGGADVELARLDVHGPASWQGDLNMGKRNMNFYLPAGLGWNDPMLTVSGYADIEASTVNVGIVGDRAPLRVGDTFILIHSAVADGRRGKPANPTASGSGMQGVTLHYEFELLTTDRQLLATLTGRALNEQTKTLPEGFINGLALINQGGDLVAGAGMTQAMNVVDEKRGYGWGTFAILAGGKSRYNTGSHTDLSGISLMAGLAWVASPAAGRLTLGPFFEFGGASYDTYNSFSNAASVHGDGNLHHMGGGVLGRMDFIDLGPGHFYAEGSFRAGGVQNRYKSSDLRDAFGRRADYDAYSAYYGAHAALGYVWKITDKAALDLYAKYFWARLEGDETRLSTGDPVKFKAAESHRLRFGGRFVYAVNEYASPYIGAAYEREFDGRSRASTNGYDIGSPSLRGDTGMGELGLALKPLPDLPLFFDLGVQGYVGKREGVTGSLQIRFEF